MSDSEQPGHTGDDFAYSDCPSVIILGNIGDGLASARSAIDAAGARVSQIASLPDAMACLDARPTTDAFFVELDDSSDAALSLLDRVSQIARDDDIPAIVTAPLTCLDAVAARVGEQVELLCQPSLADRIASISHAFGLRRLSFNDISAEVDPIRLRKLADEVNRIAQALARITPEATPRPSAPAFNDSLIGYAAEPALSPLDEDAPKAGDIRQIIRHRRLREQFFIRELFADPAWDMLLDLMAARLERKEVAVSSLCIAASVPPTTALRWIKTMTDQGLFERCADPADGRRIFIRLGDRTADAMLNWLQAAKKIGGLAI